MKSLRSLRILHLAASFGLALWCALAYMYVTRHKAIDSFSEDLRLELGAVIWTFVLLLISMFLYRRSLGKVNEQLDLEERLRLYRGINILQYAIVELMAVGLAGAYAWGGQNNLLLYAMMASAYFLYLRPYPLKIIRELKLSEQDEERIRLAFK